MKHKVKEDLHGVLGIGHQTLSCCVTASVRSSFLWSFRNDASAKTCLVQLASEHTPTLCCSFKEVCRGGVSPNVLYEFWVLRVYFFPHENLTWKVPRIYITISLVNNTQVIVWGTQAVSGDCDASLTISTAWAPEFRFWGVLKIILTWSDGPGSPTLNSWL